MMNDASFAADGIINNRNGGLQSAINPERWRVPCPTSCQLVAVFRDSPLGWQLATIGNNDKLAARRTYKRALLAE